LAFELAVPVVLPGEDRRNLADLSARAMMRTMRAALPEVQRFDTTVNREVWVWLQTKHGPMSAMFDRRRISASNPHQLLVLMVVAGLVLTGISIVFMRNQLRPIKRLARASEAFGKGQVIAYEPRGAAEIRAAGKAFVAMRTRIERQIEQRTMMLSGVSHDLRTPLTRLKLGLSMQDDSAETREMLRDVDDMERLVEEFLAFARGDSLEDPEPVDPAWLVVEAVDKHRALGADVRLEMADETQEVVLHAMAVARALDNLIGNAVKYGGRAEVTLRQTPGTLSFSVEDPGPGIPPQQRGEALKPFVRLDAARNQDKGSGVGLGLAIAHDIARRHGGRLELGQSARLGGLQATLVLAR
jgi:two-component system osmolarity sensor histidine kinase EnvZ